MFTESTFGTTPQYVDLPVVARGEQGSTVKGRDIGASR
jgi:hypothetical protein